MVDCGFTEVELRRRLEYAHGHKPDLVEDRFVVTVRLRGRPWEVIVEPDGERRVVIVAAYPVERHTP